MFAIFAASLRWGQSCNFACFVRLPLACLAICATFEDMKITLPHGVTCASLANLCGVHPASMARALNDFDPVTGVHVCGASLAIAIHYASGAAVPCWALRPDIWCEGQVPPHPSASSSRAIA